MTRKRKEQKKWYQHKAVRIGAISLGLIIAVGIGLSIGAAKNVIFVSKVGHPSGSGLFDYIDTDVVKDGKVDIIDNSTGQLYNVWDNQDSIIIIPDGPGLYDELVEPTGADNVTK